jgi:hypothetical protein
MQKRERRLSIIIVPHHKAGQHSIELSYRSLRWLGMLLCVIVLFIAGLVVNYGYIFWRAGQYELMRKRQGDMEAEFAKLGALKAEMARLHGVEDKVRAMLQTNKQPDTLSVAQISSAAAPAPGAPTATLPQPADTTRSGTPSLKPVKGWVSA